MTAGIINLCGAFGGKMAGSTVYNRKGMFENTEIREKITKPFLISIGADPMCQDPLPDIEKVWECAYKWQKDKDRLQREALEVIKKNGYQEGKWFYKGAKMCLLWPMWYYAFPFAQWIVVRRKKEDIANSCLRTGFMRKRNTFEEWEDWVGVHEKRFQEMRNMNLKIKEVWPQKMINGDFSEIKSAVEWCGLQFKEREAQEFVSPELWNLGGG
jgi:hypothetical protein